MRRSRVVRGGLERELGWSCCGGACGPLAAGWAVAVIALAVEIGRSDGVRADAPSEVHQLTGVKSY